MQSFYDLEFNDTRGNPISMNDFKGKVVLIVNTATKCGLAPQFEELEALHQKYNDQNFVLLGFPCNQFAGQEPVSNESMAQTCKLNFGVTFFLAQKIYVNGENTHPVFQWLKDNTKAGLLGKKIKWNFTKFLMDAEGKPYKRYAPTTKPGKIEADIVKLLG